MTFLVLGVLLLVVGIAITYVQGVPFWVGSVLRGLSYAFLAYGAYRYFVSSLGRSGAVFNMFTGKVTRL